MWNSQIKSLKNLTISTAIMKLNKLISDIDSNSSSAMIGFREIIPQLMALIFGDNNQKGWMTEIYEEVNKFGNIQSFKKLNYLTDFLSPKKSKFFNMLFHISHSACTLDFIHLPEYLQIQIEKNKKNKLPSSSLQFYCKSLQFKQNIKHNQILLSLGQWYLTMFIIKMKEFISSPRTSKGYQSFVQDEFYHDFVRNPFLILTRRYLKYFKQIERNDSNKFVILLRQYCIKDFYLINKQKQNFKPTANNFKTHILQVIQLIIYFNYQKLKHEQMNLFFNTSLKNWNSVGSCHISDFIRIWIFYISAENSMEQTVINRLEQNEFDEEGRIYKIKKIIDLDIENQQQQQFPHSYSQNMVQIFYNIMNVIIRQNQIISYRHIYGMGILLSIFSKLNEPKALLDKLEEKNKANIKIGEKYQNQKSLIVKLLRRIDIYVKSSNFGRQMSVSQFQQIQDNINILHKLIKQKVKEIYNLNESDLQKDNSSDTKKIFIKHVSAKYNDWETPIADHQFSIAYYVLIVIAKIIDIITFQGSTGYPKTNLRKLCNLNFSLVFVVLLLFIYMIFRDTDELD